MSISLLSTNWQDGITIWAVGSLITLAIIQFKKPFITPEVKTFNCHYCGAKMNTSELMCQNCESKSSMGKSK